MATRGGAKEARSSGSAGCSRFGAAVCPRHARYAGGLAEQQNGLRLWPSSAQRELEATASNGFIGGSEDQKRTDEVDRNRKLARADWRGRGDQTLAGGANDARWR